MLCSQSISEEIIFAIAFASVFGLLQLPFEEINGYPVPTVIFKGKPTFFHAFVLGLNFAFCGAVATISLRELHPKLATISRLVAVVSISAAGALLAWLAFPLLSDLPLIYIL